MPRRDGFHQAVRTALERDGWTVTDDPLVVPVGLHNVFVDLGAERLLAAQRGAERIAVEVKSFIGRSAVADLEQALGQYVLYRGLLRRSDPGRQLLLAIPKAIHESLLTSELGRVACEEVGLTMVVFDPSSEVILQWFR